MKKNTWRGLKKGTIIVGFLGYTLKPHARKFLQNTTEPVSVRISVLGIDQIVFVSRMWMVK